MLKGHIDHKLITTEFKKKTSLKDTNKKVKKTGILMSILPLAACVGGDGSGDGLTSSLSGAGTLALDGFDDNGDNSYSASNDSGGTFLAQGATTNLIVTGGDSDDSITTSGGDDMIRGGNGVDTINAGAGDDAIVIIGTTTANQYTASSITNSAGTGTDLSSLITLADLNGRSVSEVAPGEVIDGGTGVNTLFIYGTVDLTGVTLNNIEVLVVNSNVTLTEQQLRGFTTIDGDGESVLNIVVPDGAEGVTLDLTQYEIHDIGTLNIIGDITIIINDISDIAEIGHITVADLSQITLSIRSDENGVTNINLGDLAATFEKIDIIETGVDVIIEVDDDSHIDDLELDGIEGYGDIEDNREGDGVHDLNDYDHTEEYNYAPALEADLEDTHEGQEVWLDVLYNDQDESDLTITGIELVGSKGTAQVIKNGILFDPGDDFNYLNNGQTAEVKIWYTASDGEKSSTSYVQVIIGGESEASNTGEGDVYIGDFLFDGEYTFVAEDGANRTLDKSDYDGNYTVTGADSDDHITMGGGNDVVDGMGGNDFISTGGGDDRIVYGEGDTIDGGEGFDTLVIKQENLTLDLSSLDAMNIEALDLGVETDIILSVQDVLNLASENQDLIIFGDENDGVTFTGSATWDFISQDEIEGQMMNVYQSGDASLLIDTDITQGII